VNRHFAKRNLRRRVIALAAAYAIALSSLIASFGTALAAAEAAAVPGGIICHTLIGGQQTPSPADSNGKMCTDCCCVGCMMPLAAVPPAPASAAPLLQASSHRIAAPAIAALDGGREAKYHRSRAPPLTA
jgi:hypothetical protein